MKVDTRKIFRNVAIGDFNSLFLGLIKSSRQKINMNTENITNIVKN